MMWIPLHRMLRDVRDSVPYTRRPDRTRGELARAALGVAGGLQAAGMRRLGLWFDDAAQLAIALLACWRAGIVAVLASDARPATCVAIDAGVDGWLTDFESLPVPCGRLHLLGDLANGSAALAPEALDPDAAGVVVWTSGSSGQPRPIHKRWRQLEAELDALERTWHWADRPACVLGAVSPQHMYGLPFRVLWPLCAGRSIAPRQLAYPEDLERATLRHDACVWIASPALLTRLGELRDWPGMAARVEHIYSAGGPLPAATSDRLRARLGRPVIDVYGSSETGAVAWRHGAEAWRPLPRVTVSLSEAGTLAIASPWLPDDAIEHTADLASMEGGCFTLLGRADRIVKIEERRVALASVEAALARHPCVQEARVARCAGTPRLTALVALSGVGLQALRDGGRQALAGALRRHLALHVEPLAVPRRWRFLRQLPWNAQGKLPQAAFDAAARRPLLPELRDACGSATQWQGRLDIPPDLAHFDGHFPAAPVVPGVALVGWAHAFGRAHFAPRMRSARVCALKFRRLIRPGDRVDLHLRWNGANARLQFEYRIDGVECASGSLHLASAPGVGR
jgi:acyl-coenzyme A synthetase/AMP-(fatty) acid ligase/3-hydroxymyristoyl/3-hydroxydecanoyl-(acyl carrier protein) dehydratase